MPVYVTENGVSDDTGTIFDLERIYYYKHYINELLKGKLWTFGINIDENSMIF